MIQVDETLWKICKYLAEGSVEELTNILNTIGITIKDNDGKYKCINTILNELSTYYSKKVGDKTVR